MMTVKIILNPYAKRWQAKEQIPAIKAAFEAEGVAIDLVPTEGPEHGIMLAKTAVEAGVDAVIAAGGDGTINEIINGVLQATPEGNETIPFGVLPMGTANDFGLMMELPNDIESCARMVAGGKTRVIDAGMVEGQSNGRSLVRYFINNSAIAMEPMVTLENIKMKRLSGEIRYVVALIRAIVKIKAWQMRITWDDGGFEGPAYLLSVCNGPRTGGFQIAPEALFDDGLFDIVFAPEVSKTTLIAALFRLMQGTLIYHPEVTFTRTTKVTIDSDPGTPIHADGEVFSESVTAMTYQILPDKVTLLIP